MKSHPRLPDRTARVGRALALGLAAAALLGCAADPALAPHEKMPAPADVAAKLHLMPADTAAAPNSAWWSSYHDAELARWIELGQRDSPDLRIASARLADAEAYVAATRAGEAPSVNLNAQSNSERLSGNGIFPPPLGGMVGTINDIDLGATLELDLFGRLSSRTDAARLAAQAGAYDRDLAGVRLAGAIGHAYFELARAQQARRIAVEIETDRAKTLELVRDRVRAGLDTQVERRLAEVTVPEIRVDIERADEQIALARHGLAVLAGQAPDAADAVQARLPDDATLAAPAALPLDLLARRADIAAAQRRVAATLRGVDAAKADFYPNVNIAALVGLDSLGAQKLFESNSRTWQVGPAVHLPIFEGGSLRAALRSASAQTDAAIDAYNALILQAAREVADASSSIAAVRRQRAQQELATANAQVAADLAVTRYRAGLGNFLTVLTAQGAVLSQRRSEVDLNARAASLDVTLALALGGGFRQTPATNTTVSRE
jgi:NodT family efflux transporter outer membrane factor (OMF) lipoprotein